MLNFFRKNLSNHDAANDAQLLDRTFKKKIQRLSKDLKNCRQKQNSQAEALCLEETGFAYFDVRKYDEAIQNWTDALRVYQEVNDRKSMAQSYSNIGTAYRLQGDIRSAAKFYNKALLLDREFNPGNAELISLHNLGGAWMDLEEYENALESFSNALEISRQAKLVVWEGWTLCRLGATYQMMQHYIEAFGFFENGLKIAETLKQLELMILCTFGMGHCYEYLGEYSQAIPSYQDVLDGSVNLGNNTLQVTALIAMAHLNIHLGFWDLAREQARQASELMRDDPGSCLGIELGLLKADIYALQGLWEKAFRAIEELIVHASRLNLSHYIGKVLMKKAMYEIETGRYETAHTTIETINRSIDITKSSLLNLEVTLALGKIFHGLKQDDQAMAYREEAVRKAGLLAIPRYLWQAHYSLGRLYFVQQRYDHARDEFHVALRWIDHSSQSLDPSFRKTFLHHKERILIYQDYIMLQITTGHKEHALRVLKRLDSDMLYRKVRHFFE